MTIKEMEEHSGMVRANIRYYEAEGLLTPVRASNGYRDYSEHDLECLLRIKLLRTLHMTIEEIKALQAGERELGEALRTHLEKLKEEDLHLQRSQEICQEICRDGAEYATLDAPKYLAAMEWLAEEEKPDGEKSNREEQTGSYPSEYFQDQLPPAFAPWRRYFARMLDIGIYQMLLLALVFRVVSPNYILRVRGSGWSILEYVVNLLILLLLEPLLITLFQTTPGKWMLGLKVTNLHGGRLSYVDAVERTWKVFWRGMGGNIPIYNLVRNYKSYEGYLAGETLDWEVNSSLEVQEESGWSARRSFLVHTGRLAGYFLIIFAMLALMTVSALEAAMPKHRGDISVEQFAENCNAYMDYFKVNSGKRLDSKGKWVNVREEDPNAIVIEVGPGGQPLVRLDFVYTEEDGVLTSIRAEADLDTKYVPLSYQQDAVMAVNAFVKAQGGTLLPGGEDEQIIRELENASLRSFTRTAYGVTVSARVSPISRKDFSSGGSYQFQLVIERADATALP